MKRFLTYIFLVFTLFSFTELRAQSTFGIIGGYGMSNARFYPVQETKAIWGSKSGGVSWRYYTETRFAGGVGVDLLWMERGYRYAPYASFYEDKKDYKYYRRDYNSIMLPLVWQPHFYMFNRHLRTYLEAAVTFNYNFSSKFENEETNTHGKYEFKNVRDNRFGYGLAGGAGIDILVKQFEFGVKAWYYFGFSDILKNRNKYYNYATDNQVIKGENPFYYTPLRSPVDNIVISFKVAYRFNKDGFKEWNQKKKKTVKNKEVFKMEL